MGDNMRRAISVLLFGCLLLAVAPAPSFGDDTAEIAFWNSIKDSKNPAELKAYIEKYPKGSFSDLAKIRLEGLQPKSASPAPAPKSDAPAVKWAALSFTADGTTGWVWGRDSREQAEQDALTRCVNMGGRNCKTSTSTKCIGLAVYKGKTSRRRTEWGGLTAGGDNVAEAMNAALQRCRDNGVAPNSCNLRTMVCADGSHQR